MPEGITGAVWAFGWGLAAVSGVLAGALLGVMARLPHRAIAAIMSFGAGVLVTAASLSVKIASEALVATGTTFTAAGILAGAAMLILANAALPTARNRKRCGECTVQPSEADTPGSGRSIVLGAALDALPEALVLGVALRIGGRDVALVVAALALSNVSAAVSATSGMRLASRSSTFIFSLWSGIALVTAVATSLTFCLVSNLATRPTATLKAFAAGALIAMAAETMIPEAFHNGPRYSGVLAAAGFAALILLTGVTK